MTMNVLFACPHSAGKSLFAATYFRAAAARNGLDVVISVAGPQPDEYNMSNVQGSLESQGYTIGWRPKLIDRSDTDAAHMIVSIGCDPSDIPTDGEIVEWQVPLLSEDFGGAMNSIHARAEALASELAQGL